MRVLRRLEYKPPVVRVLFGLVLGVTGLIVLAGIIMSPTVVVSQSSAISASAASSGAPDAPRNNPAILGRANDTPQATPAPPGDRQHYVRGDSNIVFRWNVLVDYIALYISYAWLCCGAIAIAALPVFFVVLWVKARNRPQA